MVDSAAGSRPAVWPMYLGGFLGPFGAAVVTTMLPELGDSMIWLLPIQIATWWMVLGLDVLLAKNTRSPGCRSLREILFD